MRIHQWLSAIFFLFLSCHSPESKAPPSSLKAEDTVKDAVQSATRPANDSTVMILTHLRDTTYAAGNFILFLRPDDARYAELERTLRMARAMETRILALVSRLPKTV